MPLNEEQLQTLKEIRRNTKQEIKDTKALHKELTSNTNKYTQEISDKVAELEFINNKLNTKDPVELNGEDAHSFWGCCCGIQ